MAERETLTTKEAGELLGVSATTITRMVGAKELEGFKLNPHRRNSPFRIFRDSVDKLLKRRHDETLS